MYTIESAMTLGAAVVIGLVVRQINAWQDTRVGLAV
jgi:hypothetical protein